MPDRPAMNDTLTLLERSIARGWGQALCPDAWTHPGSRERLEATCIAFDRIAISASDRRVALAVAAFRRTKSIPNTIALKYICFGAGQIDDGWCALGDPDLCEILLSFAGKGSLRAQLKCFQALLRTYFTFARCDEQTPANALEGWTRLRSWLLSQYVRLGQTLEQAGLRAPGWFGLINDHVNLLTSAPCDVYADALASGDAGVLHEVRIVLAIPQDSWLWEEALLAHVRKVVAFADAAFRESVSPILTMVFSHSDLRISPRLSARCVALLVSRYARCSVRPENLALRDAALRAIGNPWLRRQAWDAYVLDFAGKPDAAACSLILGWLRLRLIKDFFELLSEDRAAEPRRLQYWLRFEPVIEDMWFVLGSQARKSSHAEYLAFCQRAQGRVLALAGRTAPTNNAFVMRIGGSLVVEFGLINNACFVLAPERLDERVASKLANSGEQQQVEIEYLRVGLKLVHRDNPRAQETWETKFDQTIIPLADYNPMQPPKHAPPPSPLRREDLATLAANRGLSIEDNRSRGGACWVLNGNLDEDVTRQLRGWGFQYRAEKGWWKQ